VTSRNADREIIVVGSSCRDDTGGLAVMRFAAECAIHEDLRLGCPSEASKGLAVLAGFQCALAQPFDSPTKTACLGLLRNCRGCD